MIAIDHAALWKIVGRGIFSLVAAAALAGALAFDTGAAAQTAAAPVEMAAPTADNAVMTTIFLLPVFVLSGAFAPVEQLPQTIRYIAEIFPLTHFCRAFRLVNMYHASLAFYLINLVVLFGGAVVTFVGAALLLQRIEE